MVYNRLLRFNFIVSPSTSFATLQQGNGIALQGQSNVAAVSFDEYGGNLRICSV
ncbi:hypothetical protein HW132_34970 [Brasilonema sp. CT11]|nr:hypothetical protein [Brasilonema sp. CT11]